MGRRNKSKQNQDEEGRRGEEEKSKKTWHVHSAQHKKRSIVMAFVRPCGLLVPGTPPRPKGQREREKEKKITIAPRWMCVLDERKPNRWRAINGKERRKKTPFFFQCWLHLYGIRACVCIYNNQDVFVSNPPLLPITQVIKQRAGEEKQARALYKPPQQRSIDIAQSIRPFKKPQREGYSDTVVDNGERSADVVFFLL